MGLSQEGPIAVYTKMLTFGFCSFILGLSERARAGGYKLKGDRLLRKRLFSFALISILGLGFLPYQAFAASVPILISELQTGTTASASQEFVELYNPTDQDVNLNSWTVEYKPASSGSWAKRATLAGIIKSHGFYLIAPKTYLPQADNDFSSGLSGTGGHVRLLDDSKTVMDLVGWSETANAAETAPAPAPPAGQSIERLAGRLIEDGGNAVDTDDNSKDFVIRTTPQPQSTASALEVPAASNDLPDPDKPVDDPSPVAVSYLPLQLSELLINPASPLTDAKDEFIEIYNPNSQPVSLNGYTLRTGSDFHDYYVLGEVNIAPNDYYTVYSSDSHLSLTNSGGAAQLLDPTGAVVSQSDNYEAAPDGQSWALIDGSWQWTLQTTPDRPNVLVKPIVDLTATGSTAAASTKKTTSTAAKSTKTTAPKSTTTKVAAAKTTKPSTAKEVSSAVAAATESKTGRWLLIGALVITIGYGIYEFRYDLQNFYYLGKRKFGLGRTAGPRS